MGTIKQLINTITILGKHIWNNYRERVIIIGIALLLVYPYNLALRAVYDKYVAEWVTDNITDKIFK